MKLPATVRIGYRLYRLEEWEPVESIGANRYGECCNTALVIRVTTLYGHREAANTLLHEIMHAIFYVYGLGEDDPEERIVRTLTNALCATWTDNPDVIAWINEGLAE